MIVRRIDGATRVLGAPADWIDDGANCAGLPIRDVETDDGPFMLSAWEPTPDEIARMQAGESVVLWIRGTVHPVVTIVVGK